MLYLHAFVQAVAGNCKTADSINFFRNEDDMEPVSPVASATATKNDSTAFSIPAPIYWLALGAFAIGTEGFMIAPLLPGLAQDLQVSIETAGQLVTVFALAYGLSSPILTALTAGFERRKLLLLSMVAFTLSNILAWSSHSYWALMGARILLAFSAGLFVPGAHALASALVPPERRGRALAVVNGGMTVAIALGVPLGAIIGHSLGWRMTFAGVALLAAIATVSLVFGLPKGVGAGIPTANLRERMAVARKPVVLLTLLVTTLWATGAYTVYTYLALFLSSVTGLQGAHVGMVLFMWGVAAAIGVTLGGNLNDRFGPRAVIVPTILAGGLAFMSLSLSADYLTPSAALLPVLTAIVVWGIAHWAFYPAQQARLIEIGGLKVAPIALSLNASFMYIGFSAGAALGALTLAKGTVADLGWVAGLCELAAVLLTLALTYRRRDVVKTCAT
jgi:predicted MFS family arabinose efflux permease